MPFGLRFLVIVITLEVSTGTRQGGEGGAYLLVACLSHLTIDHASLSRRSTVPTPISGDTSNIEALITFFSGG